MTPKRRRRIVTPTHFLFLNIFRHKKISEIQKGSSKKCLGIVTQKLPTKNHETLPPPMPEKFRLLNFWNTKRFPYENFRYCEPKKLTWIVMPAPLFTSTFFNIKNFLKHRWVPLRNVSLLENKHFRSTVVIPDPFFLQNFLHLENYLNHRRVPWRTLLVLWNKIVLRRIVIPLPFLCMKIFEARFFWSEEVFPNEMFQYCETKKIDGESWCPPRFLSRTLFGLKKILKHNRVPLRKVSVLWDFSGEKKLQRRIMIHLALLCMINFDIKNLLEHKSVPLRNASVLWAKNTDEDLHAHPLSFS